MPDSLVEPGQLWSRTCDPKQIVLVIGYWLQRRDIPWRIVLTFPVKRMTTAMRTSELLEDWKRIA